MDDPVTDLQELLDLARNTSLASRRVLLCTISDLFGEKNEVLTERERALMCDILNKLVRDFETAVRRDLAERMAARRNTPHELLLILANDEIEVARPILKQSEVLRDKELIEIIQHRTLQHQLAIAMRRMVSAEVSDALVETSNADVIKALLENQSARISEATMEYLVEESRRVDSYQEPLVKRDDLDLHLAKRLCRWVSAALRSHILEHYDIDPTALDDQLQQTMRQIAPNDLPRDIRLQRPRTSAQALAEHLAEDDQLTPKQMIHVLRDGEISLFEAMFGQLTGLEPPRLQRVIYDPAGKSMAIVCRAVGVDKPIFASLFLLSRKGRPSDRVTDPQEVAQVMDLFDRIDPKAAEKVLRQWQRDTEFQEAIDQIEEARRAPQAG